MRQKGLALLLPLASLSGLFAGLVVGLLIVRHGAVNDSIAQNDLQDDQGQVTSNDSAATKDTKIQGIPDVDELQSKTETTKEDEPKTKDTKEDVADTATSLDDVKGDGNQNPKAAPNWVLRFNVLPKKAKALSTIRVNENLLDGNLFKIPQSKDEAFDAEVYVEAIGYAPFKQSLSIDSNQTIVVNLVPLKEDSSKKDLITKDATQSDSKSKSASGNKKTDTKKSTKTSTTKTTDTKKSDKPDNVKKDTKKAGRKGPGGLIDL